VADQAGGGEILVSEDVTHTVEESEFEFSASREAELKGLPGTHTLLAVSWRDD
jgi:hypothetical protein